MAKHIIRLVSMLVLVLTTFVLLPGRVQAFLPPHDSSNNIGCEDCHAVHSVSGSFGLMPRGAQQEAMCVSCHNETGIASAKVDVGNHLVNGGGTIIDCGSCHDMHVSHVTDNSSHGGGAAANLSLIRSDTSKYVTGALEPAIFQAQPAHFSFDSPPYTGICQSCHTNTSHHRNDGTDFSHNFGVDCTACHPHNTGFAPTGGSCTTCHNTAQDNGDGTPVGGRRAIVGEFSRTSHHVNGPIEDGDCVVCHDQSGHQQGYVKLKDPDGGASITLNADPYTNPTEAVKLESFCLNCHDADAAGGSNPFSDGQTPPVIDSTHWTASTHKNNTTCFGASGCHDNGHGSAEAKLLPLADENLCYSCHDGGTASDIQAQFALANIHALDNGSNNTGLECVTCHNPHEASSTYRLANPDTGAQWTGDNTDFCMACHDGNPPAGITFPTRTAAQTGSGYNKASFAASSHDTSIGIDACQACHYEHGSGNLSMLVANYTIADYTSWNSSDDDYKYAICWSCHQVPQYGSPDHDSSSIINNKNAFESRHDTHVKGEDAPCFICHDVHAPYDAGEVGLINLQMAIDKGYDISHIGGRNGSTSFWTNPSPPGFQNGDGFCYIRCHGKDHKPKDYQRKDELQ